MDNIEKDIAQGYADFADDEGSIEEVKTEENQSKICLVGTILRPFLLNSYS